MALKTLADCKPSEFLAQTVRIKRSVARWLTDTDILNIRQRMPANIITLPADASAEERAKAIRANAAAQREQTLRNLSAIFDAAFELHPEETLEVLALCCFVEPQNVDDHIVAEYLSAFTRLISDEAVLGFFSSLAQWGQTRGLTAAGR